MAYTHKPREEAEKNAFFKSINKITERFFNGEDLDLAQLSTIALNGNIEISRQTVTLKDAFNIESTFEWKGNQIAVLSINCDISGKTIGEILKNEYLSLFEDLNHTHTTEECIALFKHCIEKKVIAEVPSSRKRRNMEIVKNKLPLSYIYISEERDHDKKQMFFTHKRTTNSGDEYKVFTTGNRRNPTYTPPLFKQHSYLIVKQKNN